MKALVLSGGGLFGAWQAGAWSVLSKTYQPDLIVGVSIGSLNGYLIASGATPDELLSIWRDPRLRGFNHFHSNLKLLTSRYTLRRPFALAVTDSLTLSPKIYRDGEITWQHLAASCAVPIALPQVKLDGRWSTDGGLLGPLPVWAALELGATEILGLNVLKQFPSPLLAPFVIAFRAMFGVSTKIPPGVRVEVLGPSERLGGLRETIRGSSADIERWIELGARDAAAGQR